MRFGRFDGEKRKSGLIEHVSKGMQRLGVAGWAANENLFPLNYRGRPHVLDVCQESRGSYG